MYIDFKFENYISDAATQTDMDLICSSIAADHAYATPPSDVSPASCLTVNAGGDSSFPRMPDVTEDNIFTPHPPAKVVVDHSEENVSDCEFGDSLSMVEDHQDQDYIPTDSSNESSDEESDSEISMPLEDIDMMYIEPNNVSDQRKFLVFESALMNLFVKCQKPGCAAKVKDLKRTLSGSRLIVMTKCVAGCNYTWSSQPVLDRMGAGNLLLSAAILFSGSTYTRFQDIGSLLNMPILGETQYYSIQKKYLFPIVNETWLSSQNAVLDGLSGEDYIVMSGDGRCDSPGHSAKYGTYTLMDSARGLVVDFSVLSTADPEVKSSNSMEPIGLQKCLENLKKLKINISVLATDRHPSIRKILREKYPTINHQFDVWHFVKNFIKKIVKICGKKKSMATLLAWVPSISNHFWWSVATCCGDVNILKEKWESVIYHTVNIHSWADKKYIHECAHASLPAEEVREVIWLRVGSEAHDALIKVVRAKDLQNDLKYCTLFCHTGQLEVYHSLILKYAPKRQHFSYEGMICRTQLAAIDHNHNVGRPQAKTSAGVPRYSIVCPKVHTKNRKWVAKPIMEAKDYQFREEMMRDVIVMRTHGLPKSRAVLPVVKQNIAPVERPDKAEVIARSTRYSRFSAK